MKEGVYPVTALFIGGGSRASLYARYATEEPKEFKVIAIADPKKVCQTRFQHAFDIPNSRCFSDWKEAAASPKCADCVVIALPDDLHKDTAISFAEKGYHILLEKPLTNSEKDCEEVVKACEEHKVILVVGHGLRYAPETRKVKELIETGAIGDVVHIQITNPLGFLNFAHLFVRGMWRNSKDGSSTLLTECGMDFDLMQYWMDAASSSCESITSCGALMHFSRDNKPQGAGDRCLSCAVEATCPYSAKKLYIDMMVKKGEKGWPVSVITDIPDIENVTEALQSGPYGRCVYNCDNDVISNQVVNLQYSSGKMCTLTMVAFTPGFTERQCKRQVKIYGSHGELTCDIGDGCVVQHNFLTGKTVEHNTKKVKTHLKGHGRADYHFMHAFVEAVAARDPSRLLSKPRDILATYRLLFAAERARLTGRVVDVRELDTSRGVSRSGTPPADNNHLAGNNHTNNHSGGSHGSPRLDNGNKKSSADHIKKTLTLAVDTLAHSLRISKGGSPLSNGSDKSTPSPKHHQLPIVDNPPS